MKPRPRIVGRAGAVAGGLVLLAAVLWSVPPPVRAASPYRPPSSAPVVDRFRPPSSPYGPGNRGWAYASAVGSPVLASAAGEVVFSGQVAGALHITVLHPDGLRTSYSFLATVRVRAGDRVAAGMLLGTATDHLHFGVRDPSGAYLDPAAVIEVPVPMIDGARLLPDGEVAHRLERPPPGRRPIGGDGRPGGDAADAESRDALAPWVPPVGSCTPQGRSLPPPRERRVVVLVGGLGSTSEMAGIDRLQTATAGVAPADVVRFSYAGGRVPDPADAPDLQSVRSTPYRSVDTQQDLATSAERLTALLLAVRQAAPGASIHVVGHSLGGLVARDAMAGLPAAVVTSVVTLASPHRGAPLADLALVLGPDASAAALLGTVGADLDPRLPVFRDLTSRPPPQAPAGVRFVSVAGSGDLVVPAARTLVSGGSSRLVLIHGPAAHDRLPATTEAAREVGLAMAGLPVTCPSPLALALGVAEAVGVEQMEQRAVDAARRRVGAGGGAGGR